MLFWSSVTKICRRRVADHFAKWQRLMKLADSAKNVVVRMYRARLTSALHRWRLVTTIVRAESDLESANGDKRLAGGRVLTQIILRHQRHLLLRGFFRLQEGVRFRVYLARFVRKLLVLKLRNAWDLLQENLYERTREQLDETNVRAKDLKMQVSRERAGGGALITFASPPA